MNRTEPIVKVFMLGFQKTGTTTIRDALRILGYKVAGPNFLDSRLPGKKITTSALRLTSKYDAFQDNPWPVLYKLLYSWYPDAKFILTIRDTESWFISMEKHFGLEANAMRTFIYGVGAPSKSPEIYKARYDRHKANVLEFFSDKPDSLLVINIEDLNCWNIICDFLKIKAPITPFPKSNTFADRTKRRSFLQRFSPRRLVFRISRFLE